MEKSDTNSKLTSEKRKELNLIIVNNIKRLLNQKNQTYTNLAEYLNMARASVSTSSVRKCFERFVIVIII